MLKIEENWKNISTTVSTLVKQVSYYYLYSKYYYLYLKYYDFYCNWMLKKTIIIQYYYSILLFVLILKIEGNCKKKKTYNNYHYYYCYKKIFEQNITAGLKRLAGRTPPGAADTWHLDWWPESWAYHACLPTLQAAATWRARDGWGPSMQTPSAGSPTPWVLGVDPTT